MTACDGSVLAFVLAERVMNQRGSGGVFRCHSRVPCGIWSLKFYAERKSFTKTTLKNPSFRYFTSVLEEPWTISSQILD